jgi:hypothetical protein
MKVSADGVGVVSHAGVGMLRELAQDTGLVDRVDRGVGGYVRRSVDACPGQVFADMA